MHRATYAIFALALSACSSGMEEKYFTTVGVAKPSGVCSVDPQSFARAEPIKDFSQGNGCGVTNGYKVFEISGVNFSTPATITCGVANTFNDWLQNTVQPRASSIYGQRVVGVTVAASYSCRPRNNRSGAKLSEHGFGNAIDISAFTLADGKEVNVLRDYYGSGNNSNFLSSVRRDACGPFHTVLGPGSDAEHRNHFHLDLQKERSGGPYCH